MTVDQWQLEKLALVTTKQQLLWYVPGLGAEYRERVWGRAYDTPEAAIEALTAGLAPDAVIAVIPEGPYVLARAESQVAELQRVAVRPSKQILQGELDQAGCYRVLRDHTEGCGSQGGPGLENCGWLSAL